MAMQRSPLTEYNLYSVKLPASKPIKSSLLSRRVRGLIRESLAFLVLKHFTHSNFDCIGFGKICETVEMPRGCSATGGEIRLISDPGEMRRAHSRAESGITKPRENVSWNSGPGWDNQIWLIASREHSRQEASFARLNTGLSPHSVSPPFPMSEIRGVRWEDIVVTMRNKVREEPAQLLRRERRRRNKSRPDVYLPRQLASRAVLPGIIFHGRRSL